MVTTSLKQKLNDWAGTKDIDYPNDISACFKWLVPEVYEKYGEVKTRELLEVWGWYVASGAYWGKEALALCKAIEKLLEAKGSK